VRSGTRDLPQMLSKSCPLMLQVMLFAAFQEQEICSDGRWHERTRHGTGRLLLHSIFFRRYVMKSAGHAFLRTVPKIETRFARRGWVVTSVIVPNLLALTTVMDARENTKGTCIHCKKKNICHKLCGLGRKATACTACAKAHDPEWYAAYENMQGTCTHCDKSKISTNLCGLGRKATACKACAKAHDPEWYAAYENTRGTCTHCDKNKIPTDLCGLGRKATACKACAKAHDPEWYAAYESMQGTCTHCDKSKISTNLCGLGRKATACITCAKAHDPEWYAAYESMQGTCTHCDKSKISTDLCGLGRKATACVACAKAHDPEWYAAYENMRGTCTHCDNSKIPTNLCGLGRKATACTACAKAHDPEWYAAYESMQGTCTHCDKSKINTNLCGLGRKATACITCAKAHDPEWYAAYENMRRCIYHPTTACSSKRRPDLDGYCGRCFTHLFPGDPRTKFIRTCVHHKEMAVRAFLQERFPDVTWSFDRKITDGCSSRRPDAFAHIGSHVISVEIDEFEHTDYDCSCQNRRTMELFEDAGRLPHVFVRFNPDEYYLHGEKIQGCWGKNPNTGEPRLAPKHRKQWEQRLEKLADIIEHFRSHAPSKEVESVFLFYSDC